MKGLRRGTKGNWVRLRSKCRRKQKKKCTVNKSAAEITAIRRNNVEQDKREQPRIQTISVNEAIGRGRFIDFLLFCSKSKQKKAWIQRNGIGRRHKRATARNKRKLARGNRRQDSGETKAELNENICIWLNTVEQAKR